MIRTDIVSAFVICGAAAALARPQPGEVTGILKLSSTPPTQIEVGGVVLRTGVGGIVLNEFGAITVGDSDSPLHAAIDYEIQGDELQLTLSGDKSLVTTVNGLSQGRLPLRLRLMREPLKIELKHPAGGSRIALVLAFQRVPTGPAEIPPLPMVSKADPAPRTLKTGGRAAGDMTVACTLQLDASSEPRTLTVSYEISGDRVRCFLAPAAP